MVFRSKGWLSRDKQLVLMYANLFLQSCSYNCLIFVGGGSGLGLGIRISFLQSSMTFNICFEGWGGVGGCCCCFLGWVLVILFVLFLFCFFDVVYFVFVGGRAHHISFRTSYNIYLQFWAKCLPNNFLSRIYSNINLRLLDIRRRYLNVVTSRLFVSSNGVVKVHTLCSRLA